MHHVRNLNGKPMTQGQINAYLDRIGMEGIPVKKDLAYLTKLQYAHITHIPFENLDIMAGVPISLERDALFEKIIRRKRGGVCSELNMLYNWFLESLNFQVTSYVSRIIAESRPLQAASHRVIVVAEDGESYLTDVGFNYQHHRKPMMLREHLICDDGDCQYKLEQDDFFGWVMWQKRPRSGWRRKLSFTETPQLDLDFVYPTFFAQEHPDSVINKATKVSLYLPQEQGRFYAIRGGQFLREEGGEVEVLEELTSKEQELRILNEVFHL
ncbi:MAG: arylamine N-acetyltransferase [Firmicutes bacterium]|nr:arylamine N-acetyltransferase [Bacillota bacterium]